VDERRQLFASTREQFEDDIIIGERRALPVSSVSDWTVRKMSFARNATTPMTGMNFPTKNISDASMK
ncbi:hypothetical protein RF19_25035, partial [Salmonella enterica]|nr:hypothetical protein [Salmonella enterica]